MTDYLSRMNKKFSLFDCPLVNNFSQTSKTESADLTKIFDNTLVSAEPVNAVTLVQNHDTQPGQALYLPVEDFFKPLAYALILLRHAGYPAVFYGDLYGISGPEEKGFPPSCGGQLGDLILARKLYAYGQEDSYFDFATCVGWVRLGTWDRKEGCAVVMSNAGPGEKKMWVGEMHKGETWTDVVCDPWRVRSGADVGSWDGVVGRLLLGRMDLGSLFVRNVRLVFLLMRLRKGEINLGKGTTLFDQTNLH
jgi:alpha-amylase